MAEDTGSIPTGGDIFMPEFPGAIFCYFYSGEVLIVRIYYFLTFRITNLCLIIFFSDPDRDPLGPVRGGGRRAEDAALLFVRRHGRRRLDAGVPESTRQHQHEHYHHEVSNHSNINMSTTTMR